MAPALNTHRRPFNTRGRGRGRGRPRLYGPGGSMMGTRNVPGFPAQPQSMNGAEKATTPSRRGRGYKLMNGERRIAGLTFIRDVSAIMGDPTAPGYKPREEWSYLEFHPDLDVQMALPVMGAEDVDGDDYQPPMLILAGNDTAPKDTPTNPQQDGSHTVLPIRTASDAQPPPVPASEKTASPLLENDDLVVSDLVPPPATPASRPSRSAATSSRRGGPGRPPKTPKPPAPKPPAEVLNLPKPSYRLRPSYTFSSTHSAPNLIASSTYQPTASSEGAVGLSTPMHQQHRTTKTMANIGYQESEYWTRPTYLVRDVGGFYADDLSTSTVVISCEKKEGAVSAGSGPLTAVGEISGGGGGFGAEGEKVEYDMDEQGT